MTGAARIMLVAFMLVVLAAVLALPAAAQTTGTQGEQTGYPQETFGAPPDLVETAALVDQLLRQDKFEEARATCQRVYDTAPNDAVRAIGLRGIGETYKEEYLMDEAIATFQQVLDTYPQSDQVSWAKLGIAESYTYKAQVSHPEENIALAMPILEPFLRDYPQHERAERALKFRGWCYEQLGDEQAALAEYLKAVDLYPQHRWTPGCLNRAIDLQQKFGRWDDAIASARRYLELFPDRDPVNGQLALGFCYAGKGDLGQAVVEFEKVLAQYPAYKGQCAMALFQKALSQKALGQLGAAQQTLEQLTRAYPDDYLAVQARVQLAVLGAE